MIRSRIQDLFPDLFCITRRVRSWLIAACIVRAKKSSRVRRLVGFSTRWIGSLAVEQNTRTRTCDGVADGSPYTWLTYRASRGNS